MLVSELLNALEARIPRSLSCEGDNDGAMCVPDPDAEVRRVLVTLDVTESVVVFAHENGCNVIISHHPLVFRGQKSLTTGQNVQRKLIALVKADIASAAYHTRFDAVDGGVNDTLAEALGLRGIVKFGSDDAPELGRVGELPVEMSAQGFASYVKYLLGAPFALVSGERRVKRVAVVGGEGGDFIAAARESGADVLLTGRAGYHNAVDAGENGIDIVEAGHYYTEAFAVKSLAAMVRECARDIEVDEYCENAIRAIF